MGIRATHLVDVKVNIIKKYAQAFMILKYHG